MVTKFWICPAQVLIVSAQLGTKLCKEFSINHTVQQWSVPNFDEDEIGSMIAFICTSWHIHSMLYVICILYSPKQIPLLTFHFFFHFCVFFLFSHVSIVWDQCVIINWWAEMSRVELDIFLQECASIYLFFYIPRLVIAKNHLEHV